MAAEPASRAQRLTRVRSNPASVALIIVGLVALLAGVLALWAERTLVDSDTFSDRAVEALAKEEVRLVINDALVEQIEEGVDRMKNDAADTPRQHGRFRRTRPPGPAVAPRLGG